MSQVSNAHCPSTQLPNLPEMPITSGYSKQVLDGRYISEKRLIGLLKGLFGESFECEVSKLKVKIK
jgi:hypothetical protein